MLVTVLIYLFMFFAKIIEVSLATVRIVLITKGEKFKGALIGIIEVTIWALLVTYLLNDIQENPIKLIIYALGFGVGNYVGSVVEGKLGFGTVRIEAIVKQDDGLPLIKGLREQGFAVTVVEGMGKDFKRYVLIMHVKRKRTEEVVELIKLLQMNAVITVNEIKPVYGGYGILKK